MKPTISADVQIRRVGLNRIDDLLVLEESSFPCDRISRRNLLNLLRSPSACCMAAYCGGKLAGSMILLFRAGTRSARIYSIAVAAEFRGRGIARRMMRRAELEARKRGCTRIRLEVRMDNVTAIKLYESLGFRDIAVHADYYEDGACAFIMCKEI